MIVILGSLSTFGPLSLDLYLPALPALADELDASASASQLSITACLIGLAVGQLIAGPLSDQYGRRRPLIIGVAAYAIASLACAFAPSVGVLILVRLLQGLSGAAGLVIARAIARDLYEGRTLVIFFARLILISGLAPVIAPVLGAQLTHIMSWRGIFGVLAALGVALTLVAAFGLPETRPALGRATGGIRSVGRSFGVLLRDRLFVGGALAAGLAGASMFAYISGSTFVLQRIYGLTPTGFSLAFAANAVGIMIAGQVAGRLARRWPPLRILALGLGLNLFGALLLLVVVLTGLGLPALLVALFVMVSAVGLVFPTATALTMANHPEMAGAASSLFGLSQFMIGGIAAPLVGIAGELDARPMGIVAATVSALACLVFVTVARPAARRRS